MGITQQRSNMKLPFISRKGHEQIVNEYIAKLNGAIKEKGKIVAYIPTKYPIKPDGTPMQMPGIGYCFHDRRIGWVTTKEFDSYKEYSDYLKAELPPVKQISKKRK